MSELAKRVRAIEHRARAIPRSVSEMTDAELIALIQEGVRNFTPEQTERGKTYTPTEQERAEIEAGNLESVSNDALYWLMVQGLDDAKPTNPA